MFQYTFKAVIFDLDGVITQTALVHSHAWKKMFDAFLREREKTTGDLFKEFTREDYLKYVDGKPRYDGVQSFLASRHIELPYGTPEDTPDKETVCGLGNKKNEAFNEVLRQEGVETYKSTVAFMKELRSKGIHVGVASSSKNCEAVLKAANLTGLVETRVDGVVSAQLNLKGKPAPDIFTTAAANLGVKPNDAVVIEDAASGVAAGKNGNFGLVLGIAREGNANDLLANGADIVVEDMAEMSLEKMEQWFREGRIEDSWKLEYHDYKTDNERSREALLAIGNGYFGTRGAMEESEANNVNYPGTYIAGVYNKLETQVSGKKVSNEDFVNCPNWLPVRFKIDEGEWVNINQSNIMEIHRKIDFKTGVLSRSVLVKDEEGHISKIESERFASMSEMHLAALRYKITPVNYSGNLTLWTALDGTVINSGVERYKTLNSKHLNPLKEVAEDNFISLLTETNQSHIKIAESASLDITLNEKPVDTEWVFSLETGLVSAFFEAEIEKGQTLELNKTVGIYTSREVENPLEESLKLVRNDNSYNHILDESTKERNKLWKEIDIIINGNRLSQKLIRLHLYHLLISASPNNEKLDASVTARGLHGEAYRGHIFWDELFILPFYDIHMPETARALLMYRYRRLDKAREYAGQFGYKGAMFPWQSGSDGSEETQTLHLNPVSGHWGDDYSSLQRHVSLAVAYDVWEYYHITDDKPFLENYGMEIFLEVCRFWESKTVWNEKYGRYSISGVMGPDEFHEKYPDAKEGGLTDNAYTNIMVAWLFKMADNLLNEISSESKSLLFSALNITDGEVNRWQEIRKKLRLVINEDGIIAQYDGYFDLKELDWDYYRKKYGNVYRMDRILKAEGKSADEYKVAKQADMLMTFYNLEKEVVDSLISEMGYKLPADYLEKNMEYYLKRTSHGSTLSRVVHARLAQIIGNKALSWELYSNALSSDYNDIQGGTTGEGIHAGVMAGTIMIALSTYAGVNLKNDTVEIFPQLPGTWNNMTFRFRFKGVVYQVKIDNYNVLLKTDKQVILMVFNKKVKLNANEEIEFTHPEKI